MMQRFWSSRVAATTLAASLVVALGVSMSGDARGAAGRRLRTTTAARVRPAAVDRLATGAVGLVPGQTARLNVADTCPRPPGGVRVRLLLVDAEGAPLARGERSVAAGQTISLELPRSAARPASGRVSVRAVVELLDAPCDAGDCPSLAATLEVVDDASGRTQLVLSAGPACRIPSTQPLDPNGPQ